MQNVLKIDGGDFSVSPGMDDFSSPMQKPYFCNEMRPRFTYAYTGSLTTFYHSKVLNRRACIAHSCATGYIDVYKSFFLLSVSVL